MLAQESVEWRGGGLIATFGGATHSWHEPELVPNSALRPSWRAPIPRPAAKQGENSREAEEATGQIWRHRNHQSRDGHHCEDESQDGSTFGEPFGQFTRCRLAGIGPFSRVPWVRAQEF